MRSRRFARLISDADAAIAAVKEDFEVFTLDSEGGSGVSMFDLLPKDAEGEVEQYAHHRLICTLVAEGDVTKARTLYTTWDAVEVYEWWAYKRTARWQPPERDDDDDDDGEDDDQE